ncbi:hypothetical protein OEB99_16495 [Actinotalea sp. M2MS4P-6]|uniref:hypothetical protein n=1 Tax=Actinotalea sp. M2MS4P-6 TaxID=2983762 RepID=UPI0021E383E7|nr:hypothetical protein [Actinotalea sp. M2MS4P-6]MCV2395916.1 hypothetical protein [Actinotalea sp. M2MS4P-6]
MREGAPSDVLAGWVGWRPTASVWRDGALLAGSVPINWGRFTAARSLRVPERVEFTVPDLVDGFSWVPRDPDHPLARYGQVVVLGITVTTPQGAEYETRLGQFLIHDSDHDDVGGLVRVSGLGMLNVVETDDFQVPEVPRAGGTLASEFRRLMSPGIPVSIADGLVDRDCPRSFQWPDDRLGALYDIAKAWPARILTDQWGQVGLLEPLPAVPSPVLSYTDGQGGTVVSAPTSDTREGQPNIVVATSSVTDSTALEPLSATARVTTGPLAATDDGTGYRRVVKKWSSPLATTRAQLAASAATILADESRGSVVRTVTAAPDPRPELDDAISVTRDGHTQWGWVVAVEIPLVVADAGDTMRLDVGLS